MSAIKRNFYRHGAGNLTGEAPKGRGAPKQHSRHLIKKGIANFRKWVGHPIQAATTHPTELHATKGWRHVPAWS